MIGLPASKTRVLDATIYCALNKSGVEFVRRDEIIQLRITNFPLYISMSNALIHGPYKTDSVLNRIRTLGKWVAEMPSKNKMLEGNVILTIKLSKEKSVRASIAKIEKIMAK